MSALTHLTIAEQHSMLRGGEVSPVELTEASVRRIAEVQPHLNCFVEVWADEAVRSARSLGRMDDRPFFGIPVAIKDTTPWAGHRVTFGSRSFARHVAERSGWVVERLVDAGAVIVGSTTSPEFAHAGITDSPLHGVTRNPWNPERTTGGSSGGSAAAVATGCVAVAEGSDMGGSVRIPAAWCGLVGLKPSLGRIPMDVLPGLWDTISHHGPLARSFDDAWRFLVATQGPSLRDPWSTLPRLSTMAHDVAGLRVAVSTDLGCWWVHPEIESAMQSAIDVLRSAGASTSEAPALFVPDDNRLWLNLWGIFMAAYYGRIVDENEADTDPDVVSLVRLGRTFDASAAKRLEIERTTVWRRVASVLETHDVIVCPTMSRPPGPAAKALNHRHDEARTRDDGLLHSDDMTSVWNLVSPLPVVSVPCGRHGGENDGLPIGLQVVGRPGREDVVMAVAHMIETVVGAPAWRTPS